MGAEFSCPMCNNREDNRGICIREAENAIQRPLHKGPFYGGVCIAIPVLGVQEQAHNLALFSIIITKVELAGDVVFFHCDHRLQELKGAVVWFNFHCEFGVVEVKQVMKYWVDFRAGSTGVFRALPVVVTFLKIEDNKGQKVVHVTDGEEIRSEPSVIGK